MMEWIRKYQLLHPGLRFGIKAILLILLWKLVYIYVIFPHTLINSWLTVAVGDTTVQLLNMAGHEGEFDSGRYLYVDNIRSVIVDHSCNGLELFALFIGFILIAPGRTLIKVLYSLLGLVLLYFVNVYRIYLLGLNHINDPQSFEFNHKYLYLTVIYVIIFGLWIIWLEVFNKGSFKESGRR